MKVILNRIEFKATNKENQPFLDKNGRPFERCGIQIGEYGNKWISKVPVYQDSPIKKWKVGDEVEIIITENGQYLNFDIPKPQNQSFELLKSMDKKLDLILKKIDDFEIEESGQVGDLPF